MTIPSFFGLRGLHVFILIHKAICLAMKTGRRAWTLQKALLTPLALLRANNFADTDKRRGDRNGDPAQGLGYEMVWQGYDIGSGLSCGIHVSLTTCITAQASFL